MLPSIQNSKRKGFNKRKHVVTNYLQEHSARIDDNPNIIHIDERRMNMNLFVDESNPPSMYELLRAWVEDDPERYNVCSIYFLLHFVCIYMYIVYCIL